MPALFQRKQGGEGGVRFGLIPVSDWKLLAHLQALSPDFGSRHRPRFAFRFKRVIHVVDSTTIRLVARCLAWAKHRRRKAAAKGHVRLNLQTFLPQFALVDTAGEHDNLRAREVCAGLRAREIVIFDKAYLDFFHLADLAMREVFWVTRAKDNLQCRVVRKLQAGADSNLLRDDLVALTGRSPTRRARAPETPDALESASAGRRRRGRPR